MIPMSGKSEYLYNCIFNDVKNIIKEYGYDITNITKNFMVDFEKPLQTAIKKNFPAAIIDGCFFHYLKLIWAKSKKFGLCKIQKLKKTKLILFIIKLLPFMEIDNRPDIFKKIEEYISIDDDKNYTKLIKYYNKNWLDNEYINYSELSNDEYLNRTNNYLESFHCTLNQSIDAYHPKLSYLVYKYQLFLINIYDKIKESLISKVYNKEVKFSVIKDIYDFIVKYNKKYKTDLNFNLILQSDDEETNIIYKLADYLLDLFFDIDTEDSILNKNIKNKDFKVNDDDDSVNEISSEDDICFSSCF